MTRWLMLLTTFLAVLCPFQAFCKQTPSLIRAGDIYPDLSLAAPPSPEDQAYLGLKKAEAFTLKQIQSEVVLVEMISVYCPACQRQTPFFNNLFEQISKDAELKQKVKIIGIAAGNNGVEVENFKKEFKVRYPIVPDPQFEMHSAIGGSRTPFTIIVRQGRGEVPGVVGYTHLGPLEKQDPLIASIRQIMQMDLASVRSMVITEKQTSTAIDPLYTGKDLLLIVTNAFKSVSPNVRAIEEIELPETRGLYTCMAVRKGHSQRLFAKVIARPPVCSDCHDIHFLYLFDSAGVILDIADVQLTKWGNEPWNAEDLEKMRGRVVGKSLHRPLVFNPAVDAVSSATITSAMIFDSLSQGRHLLNTLQANGWM